MRRYALVMCCPHNHKSCRQCSKTFLNQQGLLVHEKCIHVVTSTMTQDNPMGNSAASGASETEKQIEGAVKNTVENLCYLLLMKPSILKKGKRVLTNSLLFNIDRPRARCYTGSPKHAVTRAARSRVTQAAQSTLLHRQPKARCYTGSPKHVVTKAAQSTLLHRQPIISR